MDFDGSSEYINAGSTPQALVGSNSAYTVSAWVKPDATGNQNIIGAMDSGNRWYFRVLNGYASYAYGSAANGNDYQGTATPVALNTWSHVIFTFDGSTTHKIYVNGVLKITQSNGSAQTITNSQNAYIGALNNNGSTQNYFDGKIDEVAIWARALSDGSVADGATATGEVATVYNSGKPGNLIASNLNPVAYYPLGEQAQNTGFLTQEITNGWQFPNGVLQDYVMDFDGSTDFIDTSYTGLNGSSQTTISFWLNTSNTNQNAHFFGNRVVNNGLSSQFFTDGNTYIHLNSQSFSFNTSTYFSNNTWHNFVIVFNGSLAGANRLKAYVDNTPITFSSVSSTTISASTSNLLIGYSPTGGYFNGKLSNFVLWNTDQSANIANIYNNGSPQTSYTVSPQNWWKLNADSVYTPSAPNYTTSLNLPQPLSASNYIDFPTGGSGWSFNDGAGNDTPFTVSAWVYNTSSTFKYRLLSKNDGGNGYEYSISAGGANALGSIEIYLYDSTGSGTYIGSKSTLHKPNEWVHVAFTYDASAAATGLKIYANGEQLTDTDITVGSYTSMGIKTSKPNIGRTVTTVGSEGNVSNLTVFNSELTASQISTLFNFGTPETTPSFSPTLWFKLDNTTTGIQSAGSLTGASYNGTIGGSVTATSPAGVAVIPSWKIPSALPITTTPNYTTALDFDGNDYIDCGSSSNLELQTISVSFWIKETQSASSLVGVVAKNSSSNYGWIVWVDANKLIWQVGDGGASSDSFTYSKVPNFRSYAYLNQWNNICCTFDGTDAKIYINNVLHNVWTPSSPFSIDYTNIGNLNIGKRVDRTTPKLNASLSNVSIFNSTLTASQVSTLYNGGTPETAISFSPVSWWKLDTGGSTITDYGSGGNNGTNNGTATQVTSDVLATQPVNGVSTTLPSTALQQSDLQFDSPYSNYSLYFDGTVGVTTGGVTGITPSNSICFWFNNSTAAGGTGVAPLMASLNYTSTSGENFAIRLETTNKLTVVLVKNNTYVFLNSNTVLADNNWYFVTLTTSTSGSNVTNTLYINGTPDVTNTGSNNSNLADLVNGLTIGYWLAGGPDTHSFNGKIDETSIFNYSLSAAQVLEIYNNGKPSNLFDYSGTAPICWWRLGENAYFDNNNVTLPNSITGAPNGVSSGTATSMLSADAPGTYANGIGTNLDIVDRVGDAALSTSNSQSYNMIPDDKIPYVPQYVGDQISNTYSMAFDGTNYFDLGNVSSLNFERTDAFSISAWVKRVGSGTTQFIFSKATNSSPYTGYSIYINPSNQIASNINISYASNHLSVNGNSTLNTSWNHVCVTYDGSSNASGIKLYVNGSKETTSSTGQASITGTLSNSYPVNIAARNSSDLFFNGQIDEVAIFDTALTADQIKFDLYKPTSEGTNQTADVVNNLNLPTPVAWYRMGD
jgi:hypothetical protein